MTRKDRSATEKVSVLETSELQLQGLSSGSLIDDAVFTSEIPDTRVGQLYVVTLDSGEAGLFLNDDGTMVKVAGNALFTITVTTDAKVNVYFASDVLKIENKAGSTKTATIKALL
jgi:hypothetical protein